MNAATNDLVRMLVPKVELRGNGDSPPTLHGHFAVFNDWTELSGYDGSFLERIAPGAFKKTISENRDSVKVLYDHGFDPSLGNKPLGQISVLEEDSRGVRYEVPLIDTDYNRDFVIPAAEAGLLGASFRFSVVKETWEDSEGEMPKRTLDEVKLYEFGPVTFPAYEAASAGVRSRADMDLWKRLDPDGRADLVRLIRQTKGRTEAAAGTSAADTEPEPAKTTPFLDSAFDALERMKP